MTAHTSKKPRKMPRKYKTVSYLGWKIRRLSPDRWQSDNMDHKNRERKNHPTLEAAKAHVDNRSTEIENQGRGAYSLTEARRLEAVKAFQDLQGRATLSDAVSFWLAHHPDGQAATLGEMAAAWLAEQVKAGMRPTTIRQNRQRLDVYTRELGDKTPCAVVTTATMRGFLDARKCGPATRDGWRRTLRAFFQFCVDREILESNPMLKIKAAPMDEKMPDSLTEKTVARLMAAAERLHPESAPALAVMFFAGLRPVEVGGQYAVESPEVTAARKAVESAKDALQGANRHGKAQAQGEAAQRLEDAREGLQRAQEAQERERGRGASVIGGLAWEDINLRDRVIRVRPETSKNRRARLVDIPDNLLMWLAKYYKASGPVAPPPPTFKRHRQTIMDAVGMKKWTPDIARHTYATMHFAHHQNREKLAAQMGHSGTSAILEKHYKGLATPEQAARFWAIAPEGAATGQTIQLATKGA